jgi:hypothetical protein
VAVGILLAIPILLLSWTNVFLPSQDMQVAEVMATAIFMTYILLAILKRVFSAREVTPTEIYRAVNVYMMIALTLGMVYTLIEIFSPGSFASAAGELTMSALFYYSFGVLTTAGGGDIAAISPVAKSFVILEMITGVMYMAVFIGLLVNAHYSTRYSRNHDTGVVREPELHPARPVQLPFLSSGGPVTLVATGVMLNLAASVTMVALHFPLFMDTWGTSLVVMTGGFGAGALAGCIYNVIMAFAFWGGPASMLWATSSLVVAAMTWFFWNRGWIDVKRPWRLGAAGIITGLVNTPLVVLNTTVFGLAPADGPVRIAQSLAGIISSPAVRDILSECLIEVADKTLSLMLAAVVALLLQDVLRRYQPEKEGYDTVPAPYRTGPGKGT